MSLGSQPLSSSLRRSAKPSRKGSSDSPTRANHLVLFLHATVSVLSESFPRMTSRGVMKIAVPDLISNSYFPAVAAVELGILKDDGVAAEVELIFPVDRAYAALRSGAVDFVAGSAHSALSAFPEWKGVKLLCAQAQGMYWFLVMHKDIGAGRGELGAVVGRRIGAAPWVEMGLRGLLASVGIDL